MNNLKSPIIIVILLMVLGGDSPAAGREGVNVDYSAWAAVLRQYVNPQGRVNYAALKRHREGLDGFVSQIETASVEQMTPDQAKAFWINAYNALTMKLIVDKYPIRSILYVDFGFAWKVPRKAAGKRLSLGYIEHRILRPMGDPRIHFAINCASIGCPKLPTEPFFPERLDQQLDREAARFINDPEKVRLDRTTNTLYYSAIFDWFKKDFLIQSADIMEYIKGYLNEDDLRYLQSNPVRLKKMSYDWGLNEL